MAGFNSDCPFEDIFRSLVLGVSQRGNLMCSARFVDGIFSVGCGVGSDVGFLMDGVDRQSYVFEQVRGEALLVCEARYPHLFFPDSALCFTAPELLSICLRHKKLSGGWIWVIQNTAPKQGDRMSASELLQCLETHCNVPGGCFVHEVVEWLSEDVKGDINAQTFVVGCACLPTVENSSLSDGDPLVSLCAAIVESRPPLLFNSELCRAWHSKSPIFVSFSSRGVDQRVKEMAELLQCNPNDLLLICNVQNTMGRRIGHMRGGRIFPWLHHAEYIIVEGIEFDKGFILPCLLQYFNEGHVAVVDLADFTFPLSGEFFSISTHSTPPDSIPAVVFSDDADALVAQSEQTMTSFDEAVVQADVALEFASDVKAHLSS